MSLWRSLYPALRSRACPPFLGAMYVTGLAVWAAVEPTGEERELGTRTHQIDAFVHGHFGADIRRMTIALLAASVVIGAVLGIAASGLVRVREKLHPSLVRAPVRRSLLVLATVSVMHAALELRALAHDPPLYASAWYERGGWRRTVQVLATDVLGPNGVVLVALFGGALFLAGPRRQWSGWPQRVVRATRELRARARQTVAFGASGFALLLLAVVVLWRLPSAAASARPGDARPNVLVLAADSLRADRLDPRTAPHLSSLAARGTRFDRAYVSLPRTFPSWVTLLTGRHPHHHGIRSMFPRWEERACDFDAVPGRLARAGWATGVASDYAGDVFSRVDLGFGTINVPEFDFRQLVRQRVLERETPLLPVLHSRAGRAAFPVLREMNSAADPQMLARDAVRTMRSLESRGPFFLVVFFSTAHFPYGAPAPYYLRFADPSYRGRFKYHKPVGLGREPPADARDETQVRALYDGAVLAVDDAAQTVLDAVESDGIGNRTIVVVTADHGETLYDHGHGQGHGDHLFGDEGTHVPLVVVDPRQTPHRETAIVRDVDLAPTIYALTGVPPPGDLDGRSLAPAIAGQGVASQLAYAETDLWFTEDIPALPSELRLPYPGIAELTEVDTQHGDELVLRRAMRPLTIVAKHRMVRDENYKLVYVPTRKGVRWLLFDTREDPSEQHDLADTRPDVLARLEGELWAWMERDPDMTERGGYLVPREGNALPDPGTDMGLMRLDADPAGSPPAQGMP